jgi:hypothetical protein
MAVPARVDVNEVIGWRVFQKTNVVSLVSGLESDGIKL